jgi:cyclic pyranopterin phosphate synthase
LEVRYEVNEGRVATWALETHLVDECNLRCADCCTGSPELTERRERRERRERSGGGGGGEGEGSGGGNGRNGRFVDSAELEEQLARARRVLAPQVFKLTGGEPMLHPRVAEIAAIAKSSGIAPVISVTTNGLLAGAMEDAFWRSIDRMTVSSYASAPLPERTRALVRAKCAQWGVQLVVKEVVAFQRMDREVSSGAEEEREREARETFARCWLRHRCHMLFGGRFFACTRPPHLEQLGVEQGLEVDDGCELELRALLAYLEREEPLASCKHCFGGDGPWQPHRQLALTELRGLRTRGRTAPA